MVEVMSEAVASELQGLDVLVLDFPAGPPDLGQVATVSSSNRVVGDPGIFLEDLPGLVDHRQLKLIQVERIVRILERKGVHEAVGIGLPNDLPLPFGFFDHQDSELAQREKFSTHSYLVGWVE